MSVNLFLESLSASGQDITYLKTARQGGAFVATDDFWSASFRSSFRECSLGYSTFVPQVVEVSWRAEDVLHGSMKLATTDCILSNGERRIKLKCGDKVFEEVFFTILVVPISIKAR